MGILNFIFCFQLLNFFFLTNVPHSKASDEQLSSFINKNKIPSKDLLKLDAMQPFFTDNCEDSHVKPTVLEIPREMLVNSKNVPKHTKKNIKNNMTFINNDTLK